MVRWSHSPVSQDCGLNELIGTKHQEQCLMMSKCCVSVSYQCHQDNIIRITELNSRGKETLFMVWN